MKFKKFSQKKSKQTSGFKFKHFLIILALLLAVGLILVEKSSSEIKEKISDKLDRVVYENGTMNAYFCPEDSCNSIMLQEIDSSSNVSCAFYDLNDNNILDALIKKNAGLIIHYENYNATKYRNFGFSRETDGLMHDKFCTIDGRKIITGSHNPTQGKNKDNVLIIESKYLAENYKNEFQNIMNYVAPDKKKTKNTKIIFNEYELDNYFCPQDDCQKEIIAELSKAEHSVYFLMYTFTDKEIASVLVNKEHSGLEVRGAMESYQSQTYWVYPQLIAGNISVILDNEPELQHNKVFIIDNKTVITGSFNPTKAADTKNDENVIILRQPEIVQEYIDNFNYLYNTYKNNSATAK